MFSVITNIQVVATHADELEYHINVCCVTRGAHIEHL